ncbi:outer membrane lipoprotein carrier protein LolA [Peribacillus cavernae]|uniref:Outer membrane lipoprotein carrier protein LolA n=1 Tax=Peribacillus cavernae TaxID=1674310 RepID=A0A433HFA1_9BACI|nr:outer membrane lipoprotein carrier protein LolA [Peribacillus cavernae]MDQ0221328.1 outer membrane lipoprotein-sorting protein [Peribacillus cavernae]RUQ26973.1 outer membrane lipoprotein carrier protein LolA [Peribacillus cavernae]
MKKLLVLFAGIMLILVLSACGQKSQDDVVSDLNEKVGEMKGYKANAKMTLKMGADPQVYSVEVWHKNPSFYRVNLKNSQKDQSQMILRNNEGVYVLTPALNKSFKFQSEWPKNSSQAYLYESLVKDISEDKSATFKSTDKHYVFETKTRYQNNKMLPFQEITLNKKDLSPVGVKVMDPDHNPLVTVEFSKVTFNTSFDKDAFDMKKNMTGAQLEVPVMGEEKDEGFSVKYPGAEIDGISLTEEKELDMEDGKRVVLTYEGKKSFTLVQEKADVVETSLVSKTINGEPVDLGYTVGAITDNSVTWTHEGVDYMLASQDLTNNEMVKIARSVEGTAVK